MFEAILFIGVILLVVILMMLVRVGKLVGVLKGSSKDPEGENNNKANGILMLAFLIIGFGAFFWYSFATFENYDVPIASDHGEWTDTMFWITTWITGIVFVLTNVLLFFFGWKYQYKENRRAMFYPDNMKLELAWTLLPALVLTALVIGGLTVWNDITDQPSEDAEVVEIMGYQFAWALRYPGKDDRLGVYDYRLIDASNQFGMDLTDPNSYDDFSPLQMYLPVNKEVLFKIRGRDVIHSVYAPHFRLKMDAVPGMPTHFKFTPNKTTAQMREELDDPEFNYEIACAEVCGRGHFSMRMMVVVVEEDEYETWKREQTPWLRINEEYVARIPEQYREMARIKAGIGPIPTRRQAPETENTEEPEVTEEEIELETEEASI